MRVGEPLPMTIGTGVGSAVMGPSGIVAQAPFVAAGSALLPVVAPVMLFMTVSSVITGARLDRVQQALGALSENLERVRHLMEAGDYARFESAAEHLDEVGAQFEHGQRFTEGMKIELVAAKRDVKWLRRKFGHLAAREIRSAQDARLALSDINLFVLSSLLDLRADALRLHLTLQDDPPLRGAPAGRAAQESRTARTPSRRCSIAIHWRRSGSSCGRSWVRWAGSSSYRGA